MKIKNTFFFLPFSFFLLSQDIFGTEYINCIPEKTYNGGYAFICEGVRTSVIEWPQEAEYRISIAQGSEKVFNSNASDYCGENKYKFLEFRYLGSNEWRKGILNSDQDATTKLNLGCICDKAGYKMANDKVCYPENEVKYVNDPTLKKPTATTSTNSNMTSNSTNNIQNDDILKDYQLKLTQAQLAEIERKRTAEMDIYYAQKAKEDTEKLQKQIDEDKKKREALIFIENKKLKVEQNKKRLQEIRDKAKLKKSIKKVSTKK